MFLRLKHDARYAIFLYACTVVLAKHIVLNQEARFFIIVVWLISFLQILPFAATRIHTTGAMLKIAKLRSDLYVALMWVRMCKSMIFPAFE